MRLASQSIDRRDRRGVTLIEMLVVVALVVLMMVILASIFQVATGAISSSRTYQELDANLRLLDLTLRQDLSGVTARMTPPLDPAQKLGYFEYGENAPADAQGEDTDDYLAFTVKAPEGSSFSGRVWLPNVAGVNGAVGFSNLSNLPVMVTSQYAEVIYFLRAGNLYRRVLLIVPEMRGSLSPGANASGVFTPAMFNGLPVSWMAVNDISARPSTQSLTSPTNSLTPIPNDLGDLTNRENRFARPRFCNDFWNAPAATEQRDGIIDDGNFDGIPDYWPTLTATQLHLIGGNSNTVINGLINEDPNSTPGGVAGGYQRFGGNGGATTAIYAFPFLNPAMYSAPETASIDGNTAPPVGWLHALDRQTVAGVPQNANAIFNHAPLEFGDSLPAPSSSTPQAKQTWFGFPTWRETASVHWCDPVFTPATGSGSVPNSGGVGYPAGSQMFGLIPFNQTGPPPINSPNFPPPIGSMPPLGTPSGPVPPFDSDGAGDILGGTAFANPPLGVSIASATYNQLAQVWEDDLIMTGVRSFDVKALDLNATVYNSTNLIAAGNTTVSYSAGYYDLGYASTDYVKNNLFGLLTGTPYQIQDGNFNPQGFGHEGRMPPNTNDLRIDPQRPVIKSTTRPVYTLPGGVVNNNIGDNAPGLVRMRRVWDTWSTDYTNAPAVDVNLRGSTFEAAPLDQPIYPSFPPPYPQALRGIQIQIRVTDAKNDKVKILTIHQDFSDKL